MQRKSKYKSQHIFIIDYRNRFRRCNAQTLIFSMRNLGQCVWKSTFLTLVRILDEFAKCPCDRGPADDGVASRFVSVSVSPSLNHNENPISRASSVREKYMGLYKDKI